MQTSAINWSLLLNADISEKSPDNCILLAVSAIPINYFIIALCQCNVSSTGRSGSESVESSIDLKKDSRFLGLEDKHGQ